MTTYMIEYFRLHGTHRTEHRLLVEISLLDELVNCRCLRAMTVVAELSYVTLIRVFRVISHLIQSLCAYFDSSLIFAVFISTEKILRCLQLRKSRKRAEHSQSFNHCY